MHRYMNVLFYSTYRPVLEFGGIERTTCLVAKELQHFYHINCFSAYSVYKEGHTEGMTADYLLQDKKEEIIYQLRDILIQNKIDLILFQTSHPFDNYINYIFLAAKSVEHCRLIFTIHNDPLCFAYKKEHILQKIKDKKGLSKVRYKLKLKLYPIFRMQSLLHIGKHYRHIYALADKIVLLSESYIQPFMRCAMVHDRSKIVAIPNALPVKPFADDGLLDNKEHIVLMVTRLDERQKRIKLALRIWQQVMQDKRYSTWRLIVVGDGDSPCVDKYQQYAKDNNIPAVEFTGRQAPIKYYRSAAIFMMTSLFEGLPLTLLESRQFDVVPMAFDTFSPVHELIADGKDGFIIKEGDIDNYAKRLQQLMLDKDLRETMAQKGRVYLDHYSVENVMAKWYQLFQSFA